MGSLTGGQPCWPEASPPSCTQANPERSGHAAEGLGAQIRNSFGKSRLEFCDPTEATFAGWSDGLFPPVKVDP